ncbi:sensor histidine kinase KdpD [Mesorhizobium sp.]|uniref:sensor histidine kinase n=1 Tax=Mesorhizobium sp. TaxID=1871066 RepID=UPI00120BFB4F|nr:sensor histidine kinase KdpD [Mesorhizobium sp.]TIL44612.1 MAG: sensor histidine kinase KdpD [Mesorhizobium sp.]
MGNANRKAENRPDPDALLALAGGEGRGKLTLFLGAAPGVGKTFAMLTRARRLRADGTDVVVGLVETHGRTETAALLEGLEALPRRQVSHQGRQIEEFDLDAALARRPDIIIVDELAHTNAPDSRHPKRHLDIEELLAAGINVWSAMNIQHLESLSDVVAEITGVPVRERVPDIILQRADDVLLVDLAPAELIERLKEGKVYLPENAQRAVDSFFRLGNLTALREMALRRTADRVDDQMVDYLKQNAIEGPWQTTERLLVCIGADHLSEKVVRTAARLASGLNAPWLVISIERADSPPPRPEVSQRLAATFKLAESLGAETRRVTGQDFVEEILKTARREHVTQIVIGGRRQTFIAGLLRKSLPDSLIERVSGVGIHVVTGEEPASARERTFDRRLILKHPKLELGLPVAAVAIATYLGDMTDRFIDLPNVSLLYLLAVLVSAIYAGYVAALLAAVLSALAYNFFFIEPLYTFTIASPHEVFGLIVFVIAAFISGGLASRLSQQATTASSRAASTQALYSFSRKLSGTVNADDVVWTAVSQMQASLRRDVVMLSAASGELTVETAWPPDTELDVTDMMAARWAMEKNEPAGAGTGTLPGSPFQFRPLSASAGVAAVVGYRQAGEILNAEEEQMLGSILDQTAIAIDRARLSRESLDQAARLEGERFRSALLSSISHDLKTPLATITGAVSSLRELGDQMTPESRDDLLVSIGEESDRLARFVTNLLDMTRIEAGTVDAKHDWVDVADVIHGVLQRAARYFPGRPIRTSIGENLPLIRGDSVLLGQVLFNLIDNAVKYGGSEPIRIYARVDSDDVVIAVTDLGKGVPAKELESIFDKFFTRGKPDGRAPGTGLGLAIAKGFVEAMGGAISAESPAVKRRGMRVTLRFPVAEADDEAVGEA